MNKGKSLKSGIPDSDNPVNPVNPVSFFSDIPNRPTLSNQKT
jgi:hypothetical protein